MRWSTLVLFCFSVPSLAFNFRYGFIILPDTIDETCYLGYSFCSINNMIIDGALWRHIRGHSVNIFSLLYSEYFLIISYPHTLDASWYVQWWVGVLALPSILTILPWECISSFLLCCRDGSCKFNPYGLTPYIKVIKLVPKVRAMTVFSNLLLVLLWQIVD